MQIDAPEGRLSKYELIRLLGSGGMGEVYLARDTVLQRDVAIKFVAPGRVGDAAADSRLLHEARAAAALDHPCICPIYDVQTDATGRTCIVMQHVEGETLAVRLARGPMPLAEALNLTAAIADALTAADAQGIVHRDLKPQNIIMTPGGAPKLLDFGIAQTHLPPDVIASAATHTNTGGGQATGAMVGTPAYMSPEQVLKKPLDGRSDLFSLGAVLYECLTGQPAFLTGSDVETWARVVYFTPPPPSSFDPRVPAPVDGLVARLLAKEPADRFASASEVRTVIAQVGAAPAPAPAPFPWWTRRNLLHAGVTLAVVALAGGTVWRMTRVPPLPEPPADARRWYELGTEQIRDGAYSSAERALTEAVRLRPDYVQAYARLAEAQSELDEERDAQRSLLRVTDLVPDQSRLPGDEGRRLAAIRALVSRDYGRAIKDYTTLAETHPQDRGAWLDLGRAQEAGGAHADARAAYLRALQVDGQYATAHLRLGMLAARGARRDDALKEFDEAQRLYRAASDVEGQAETLLERADFLDGIGELVQAQAALTQATGLAMQTGNPSQQMRGALMSSSIKASQGDFAGARTIAEAAVNSALQSGLETVAASGLIELGTVLMRTADRDGAEVQLKSAVRLADGRGAGRVSARATLQLASLYVDGQRPAEALAAADSVIGFLRANQLRRYELVALTIMSRAREDMGEYTRARELAREVLGVAEGLKDDSEVAGALESLAGLASASGLFPEALGYREREEAIHRRQQDTTAMGFDLVNRAELLVRLGRFEAADVVIQELQRGVDGPAPVYARRVRRLALVRAFSSAARLQFPAAESEAQRVVDASRALPGPDSTSRAGDAMLAYTRARLGRTPFDRAAMALSLEKFSPMIRHDLQYWRAATWLARGDARLALEQCVAALSDLVPTPSDEVEWRVAAIGAAAARRLADGTQAVALAARARAALDRLRAAWKADAVAYERRPDLLELRKEAGLGLPQ